MNTRDYFRQTMAERRRWRSRRGGMDWDYLTRAARKYVWIMRGVPVSEWPE